MRISQAVISAGGRGKRLLPFTERAPKPMIPILGKPLLEWNLAQYKKHGVQKFFIMLGHLPQVVMDYFGDGSKWGVAIEYQVEETPLGSAGSLCSLEDVLEKQFYFLYGDVFSLVDYTTMTAAYAAKKDPIGMQRVGHAEKQSDVDLVELDGSGRFSVIHKKPHRKAYPNAFSVRGSFILDKEIISYIKNGEVNDLAHDILPRVIKGGKNFYGYECGDYSKGVDTLQKCQEVEEYLGTHHIQPWW